ncbi:hypothetical protein ENTCAN_07658 [Enterobacter cancerogenus ATCC 35316]|nr:hypothetical protein ENTCAN_07658 [Enterobacter cancerogenus ATCC 35316]
MKTRIILPSYHRGFINRPFSRRTASARGFRPHPPVQSNAQNAITPTPARATDPLRAVRENVYSRHPINAA